MLIGVSISRPPGQAAREARPRARRAPPQADLDDPLSGSHDRLVPRPPLERRRALRNAPWPGSGDATATQIELHEHAATLPALRGGPERAALPGHGARRRCHRHLRTPNTSSLREPYLTTTIDYASAAASSRQRLIAASGSAGTTGSGVCVRHPAPAGRAPSPRSRGTAARRACRAAARAPSRPGSAGRWWSRSP